MTRRAIEDWARAVAVRHAWAPLAVFCIHVVLSRGTRAYAVVPWIDAPMHAVGGFAITWFALGAARAAATRGLIGSPNRAGLLVLAFLAGTSATVYWEFAEFLADRYLGTAAQGGLLDTLQDMLLGVLGAAVQVGLAAGVARARLRRTA